MLYGGPADGGVVALRSLVVPVLVEVALPIGNQRGYLDDREELAALSVLEAVYRIGDSKLPELSAKGIFQYRFEWEPGCAG